VKQYDASYSVCKLLGMRKISGRLKIKARKKYKLKYGETWAMNNKVGSVCTREHCGTFA
jgi:hypothetical protein